VRRRVAVANLGLVVILVLGSWYLGAEVLRINPLPNSYAVTVELRGSGGLLPGNDTSYLQSVPIDVVTADEIAPSVTWGTSPADVVPITGCVPDPATIEDPARSVSARRSLEYMDLRPGQRMRDIEVQNIFIGSCTNSRIEDLRAAAAVLKGRTKAPNVRWAIVVPGSGLVKAQAEAEGLDRVFIDAGFEWREPGCSACLGMNEDKIPPGKYCISTSNRNFEGRQGPRARTFLASPLTAAAAAITGRVTDVRDLVPSALAELV